MDLKLEDVSSLLNVSTATVKKWLNEGVIPAYKINGEYRFSKQEIETWVMNHKLKNVDGHSPFRIDQDGKNDSKKGGNQKFSLYRALHKGDIFENVPGKTKEEVIKTSTQLLSQSFKFDADMLADLLLDRERLHPTALNNGIAVPHTRDFTLSPNFDVVAIVYPEKPIPYGALDGLPVHTLIFLFACNDKRHLHLLAKIAHLSNQANAVLTAKPEKEALLDYVQKWEEKIPDPS